MKKMCKILANTKRAKALLGLLIVTNSNAAILFTGNFQTGAPAPTLTITNDIALSVASSGIIGFLAFDELVPASDGSRSSANVNPPQSLQYSINSGPTMTVPVYYLVDNFAATQGSISANDGALHFAISVVAGQTLSIKAQTITFSTGGGAFNPSLPSEFTGNVFATDTIGGVLTNVVAVPEPSSSAFFCLSTVGLLAFRRVRRSRTRRG